MRRAEPITVVTLSAPARPETIDLVQDLVARADDDTGHVVSRRDRMRFETAVVEIIGNIIEHVQCAEGRTGVTVDVRVEWTAAELSARIVDDGRPSDVSLDEPGLGDDEDGRGLFMAITFTDELKFRRDGEHNVWTLRCSAA
ncbi:MAG: ATP-binding protein [Jatrophihabitans sp.]|uniref:ATP-binding protein n=1 Tax=Jatrophihabitans sp. TaxID=1932789 RepID=UPI003F7F509F